MPLPNYALTVSGGCNCGAIRYRVDIPPFTERPLNTYSRESITEMRFPMIATDHCNDCRRATASILPFWLATPIAYVSISCISRSDAQSQFTAPRESTHDVISTTLNRAEDSLRKAWLPASEVLDSSTTSEETFLAFYRSSQKVVRAFCARCGTNLSYRYAPMPDGWPEMLDILLGTVDREDLEGHDLSPERHVYWGAGLDWVHKFFDGSNVSIPKHPRSDINEVVD